MDRQIPIYFDSVVVSSPFQEIAGTSQNIGRLKVRAFTKYANRNGSYITDEVAEQLIASATKGNTPVVGFFDPSSEDWASHTGPTLANGYGYVESFEGWEPFTDTDGITRDYAVFSVVLFTDYFEEAQNILGQNQSMELNPETIKGEWAAIDSDEEYFIFSQAEILGFCVIGSHEPCFSVSAFFAKNDDTYKTQYEKFSSLLFDLKARVEEAEKGGEKTMDEFEVQEQETLEEEVQEQPIAPTDESEVTIEEVEFAAEEEETPAGEPSELELLQQQFEALQADYAAAQVRIAELEQLNESSNAIVEEVQTRNAELESRVEAYEAREAAELEQRKITLIDDYAKLIVNEDEISAIRNTIQDFSYEELESKLAIIFAKQQMGSIEEEKVPLPEPPESQFALLMKKYRKN